MISFIKHWWKCFYYGKKILALPVEITDYLWRVQDNKR